MYSVFIFPSTSLVFSSQDILTEAGIHHKIIPTPKVDKVCCGVCIRVSRDDKEEVRTLLTDSNVEISVIADIEGLRFIESIS